MKWQEGGRRGGRGYLQLPAQSGCTLFVVPLTAVDFDLCAQSGKQSCFLCPPPLPPPTPFPFPSSVHRESSKMQSNKQIASRQRMETGDDGLICLFSIHIANRSGGIQLCNCATAATLCVATAAAAAMMSMLNGIKQ